MSTHIFKAADTYHHAVDLLEKIVKTFDPAAPDMVRSDIVQVLGEELGIWPASIVIGADENIKLPSRP